jgi:hypothetical protein
MSIGQKPQNFKYISHSSMDQLILIRYLHHHRCNICRNVRPYLSPRQRPPGIKRLLHNPPINIGLQNHLHPPRQLRSPRLWKVLPPILARTSLQRERKARVGTLSHRVLGNSRTSRCISCCWSESRGEM